MRILICFTMAAGIVTEMIARGPGPWNRAGTAMIGFSIILVLLGYWHKHEHARH